MNVSLDRKQYLSGARAAADRMGDATVVSLGSSLCAVFFDRPAGRRARMQAEQDGQAIEPPFFTAELALKSGALRHVLFVPQGVETVLSRQLLLRLGGLPVAEIDPNWLQLPQGELEALTAQLSTAGLHKLLRVMLTTGASLFAERAQAGLCDVIPRLMDLCNILPVTPLAMTQIAGRVLASYPLTASLRKPMPAVAFLDDRPIRLPDLDCFAEGELLHVLLPQNLAQAQIVAVPDELPLRLASPDAALRRINATAWLKGRNAACAAWLSSRLGQRITADLDHSASSSVAEPEITVRHLSRVSTGLLHVLVLKDPSCTVQKLILERHGQQLGLTPQRGLDGTAIIAGFAELPKKSGPDRDNCQVHIQYHSGRTRLLAEPPVADFDGGIPAAYQDLWTQGIDCLSSLAQARHGFHRAAPRSVIHSFGPAQKFALRILTSIGSSADLIAARAAMILAESRNTPVEVVCTMTDGPLAVGARHALAQTAAIYGIAHRLVLLPAFATAGEHLRAALVDAQDAPALVLGADVLPDDSGWLAFWLRRLRRCDALAAVLLAPDGAIAATCEGDDPCRGLPPSHLAARGRSIARPLAQCVGLGPAGIKRLLSSGTPHPDPALWMASALAGSARSETRFPFRRFGTAVQPGSLAAALADAEFAMIEKDRQ